VDNSTAAAPFPHTETALLGRSLQYVPPDERRGVTDAMRRAVDGALDATVGRVGHSMSEAARGATTATAHQIIEDLEPYLIEEAIPRIVAGIQPHLTDAVVPEVMDGVSDYLAAVTVPRVIDGVTDHLVSVTVPQVVEGVTPRLSDDIVPRILEDLRPYLEQSLVPDILDAVMPRIRDQVAPDLVDALMPKIRDQVAPDLVDALMPKIRDEMAPQLVESLLPQIRHDIVPQIMDDIVEDPRVRDLIREQSQGLFLDALEGFRSTLAGIDTLIEQIARRLLGKKPRPKPESAMELVLAEQSVGPRRSIRMTLDELEARRAQWARLPAPPPPPGRSFTYAGVATLVLALASDISLVGLLSAQAFNTVVGILDSLFGNVPTTLAGILVVLAGSAVPVYVSLALWMTGRTLGMALVGIRVCTPDGLKPRLVRASALGWLGMIGLVFWAVTAVVSFFDSRRRALLGRMLQSEVRYSVPEGQQRRHIRDAVMQRRKEQHVSHVAAEQPDPT
jgi:uncharacterized RDD family membrane protein YckC